MDFGFWRHRTASAAVGPHPADFGFWRKRTAGTLRRLRQYTFDIGIPHGTTEAEGEIFAKVVEKKLL